MPQDVPTCILLPVRISLLNTYMRVLIPSAMSLCSAPTKHLRLIERMHRHRTAQATIVPFEALVYEQHQKGSPAMRAGLQGVPQLVPFQVPRKLRMAATPINTCPLARVLQHAK